MSDLPQGLTFDLLPLLPIPSEAKILEGRLAKEGWDLNSRKVTSVNYNTFFFRGILVVSRHTCLTCMSFT